MKQYACSHCGSSEVVRDAWASWDIVQQQWVLEDIHDAQYCRACETSGEDILDPQEITLVDSATQALVNNPAFVGNFKNQSVEVFSKAWPTKGK